jgi:hypothetical protein
VRLLRCEFCLSQGEDFAKTHLLVERKNRRAVSKEHWNSIRLQFSRSATGWRRSICLRRNIDFGERGHIRVLE